MKLYNQSRVEEDASGQVHSGHDPRLPAVKKRAINLLNGATILLSAYERWLYDAVL